MSHLRTQPEQLVPVTILTGFLGAGKTTLLNNILEQMPNSRFALIVNEFGNVSIDGQLVSVAKEEVFELNNGCICCVVRGDLIRTLRQFCEDSRQLDGIIIETTGLASPGPIVQSLVADQVLSAFYRLDSIICVVDAVNGLAQSTSNPCISEQIAMADTIQINKISDAGTLATEVEEYVRCLNPVAVIHRSDRGRVSAEAVMDSRGFDLENVHSQLAELSTTPEHTDHISKAGVSSVTLTSQETFDSARLERWIRDLLAKRNGELLRTKGIFKVAETPKQLVIQSVNMMVEGTYLEPDSSGDDGSRLVLIGKNLRRGELERGLQSCEWNADVFALAHVPPM